MTDIDATACSREELVELCMAQQAAIGDLIRATNALCEVVGKSFAVWNDNLQTVVNRHHDELARLAEKYGDEPPPTRTVN